MNANTVNSDCLVNLLATPIACLIVKGARHVIKNYGHKIKAGSPTFAEHIGSPAVMGALVCCHYLCVRLERV